MIFIVLHRWHGYTVENYLESWGRALADRVRVLSLHELAYANHLQIGTYVFGDIERLNAVELALATALADQAQAHGCRVLNHPARVPRRFDFLAKLHAAGINRYRAHRVSAGVPADVRFPCFLRRADDHHGSMTDLIHSHADLNAAISQSADAKHPELIAIEFADTSAPDGVFRKYGVMRVGDRFVPRHILFSKHWVQKQPDLYDAAMHCEEETFIATNPHLAELRRAFDVTGIDYGRIDYSIGPDGRMQVWEINSNTHLMVAPFKISPERLAGQWHSNKCQVEAFEALNGAHASNGNGNGRAEFAIRLDPRVRQAMGVTAADRITGQLGRVFGRIERIWPMKQLMRGYSRSRRLAKL